MQIVDNIIPVIVIFIIFKSYTILNNFAILRQVNNKE